MPTSLLKLVKGTLSQARMDDVSVEALLNFVTLDSSDSSRSALWRRITEALSAQSAIRVEPHRHAAGSTRPMLVGQETLGDLSSGRTLVRAAVFGRRT